MRLHWLFPSLIGLALGFMPTQVANAETEAVSTAVLGIEGVDVPPSFADEISEQLRRRVAATPDLRLVSGKDLIEIKLVFSCADESATCMAQAGKSLGAQKLLYGSVKRAGDDYAIWLKIFDVSHGRVEAGVAETLQRKNADAAGIKSATQRWFAKLLGRPVEVGTLQVSSPVRGAVVSLDGIPVGATADHPLVVSDVVPGTHEVAATKEGYKLATQNVSVGAGQTVPVKLLPMAPIAPAVLSAQAVDSDATARNRTRTGGDVGQDDGRSGYRTGFWVTLAATAVSAGAAVKFGLDVSDINKKLDPYRRFPCMNGQLCDKAGAVRPALTPAENAEVSSLNDEGSRNQKLQWICVGIGSALGVASGYLLYKGYLDGDEASPTREARNGLRIFPTAGISSSGIVAEFDF